MSLGGIIEFLASLERPHGGQIVSQAHRQDIVVGFPPSTTIYYQTTPAVGTFANVVYNYMFGDMQPDAFSYSLNYTGNWISNGVLTQDMLQWPIDFFMVVTSVQPIRLYVTNRDVVPHGWEANMYYLNVFSQNDLELLAEALSDRGGMAVYLQEILRALGGCHVEDPDKLGALYAG